MPRHEVFLFFYKYNKSWIDDAYAMMLIFYHQVKISINIDEIRIQIQSKNINKIRRQELNSNIEVSIVSSYDCFDQ